jgi:hypothetical protein
LHQRDKGKNYKQMGRDIMGNVEKEDPSLFRYFNLKIYPTEVSTKR